MSSKKEIAQCNVERAYYEGFVIKQSNGGGREMVS